MLNHEKVAVDTQAAALLLVDIQPDFMPGGTLAVGEGDQILPHVRDLMESGLFGVQVATQDWHPPGHISFASSHPPRKPFDTVKLHGHEQTLWPDHCIQGTSGALLHPSLPWDCVAAVIRKGMDPESDSYSGFQNNWNAAGHRPPTGLEGYLRSRGIKEVFICGLARDVCVKWTAEDAARAGFRVYCLWDATRAVDPDSDEKVHKDLSNLGVTIIETGQLRAPAQG